MPIHHSRSLKPLPGSGFWVPGSRFSLPVVTFKKESISEYPLSSFAAFYIHSITIISLSCGITRDINKSSMTVTPTTTYRHPFLILTQSFHIKPSQSASIILLTEKHYSHPPNPNDRDCLYLTSILTDSTSTNILPSKNYTWLSFPLNAANITLLFSIPFTVTITKTE